MNELASVAAFFKEGGIFMYFMLAVGCFAVAIAVERFLVISKASGLNGGKFVDDLVACIQRGDLQSARNRSRLSTAPAAQVAQAILEMAGADESRLQGAGDDAATLALPALSRRIAHLNVLANVSTLLGLLGTIAGLITAFSAVGAADPAQRSAFMAAGISTALNATAFGLIIAIPTLVMQGFLVGMIEGITEQVDEVSIRLCRALAPHSHASHGTPTLTVHAARPIPATPSAAPRSGLASPGGAH